MAGYYSDCDSDSSFDGDDEEYSNIDYGVHSLVSFGSPSVYEAGRRREALYELVEAPDGDNFYSKVQECFNCSLVTFRTSEVSISESYMTLRSLLSEPPISDVISLHILLHATLKMF